MWLSCQSGSFHPTPAPFLQWGSDWWWGSFSASVSIGHVWAWPYEAPLPIRISACCHSGSWCAEWIFASHVLQNSNNSTVTKGLRIKEPTPWPLNQPANKPFLPFYDHFDASLNESSNQGGSSIKILWPFSILNAHCFARSLKVTTFLLSPVRRFCNVISPWPLKASTAFLTYCDESFVNSHKHKYPLQAEEEGGGDTWAFVV